MGHRVAVCPVPQRVIVSLLVPLSRSGHSRNICVLCHEAEAALYSESQYGDVIRSQK